MDYKIKKIPDDAMIVSVDGKNYAVVIKKDVQKTPDLLARIQADIRSRMEKEAANVS